MKQTSTAIIQTRSNTQNMNTTKRKEHKQNKTWKSHIRNETKHNKTTKIKKKANKDKPLKLVTEERKQTNRKHSNETK